MRVALVYPEVFDMARYREGRKEFPPFGVMYLAAMMENRGVEVQVFSVAPDDTIRDFRGFDAVGFSISSSATYGLIKDCRFTSKYSHNTLIMAGGVHPNFYPEQTLLDLKPHVVGIGEGEGEDTILEILDAKESLNFSAISGVCYLEGSKPVRTKPRTVQRDIDWLPLPARHLLPTGDIIMRNRLSNTDLLMAHVMFSRGCPFPCRFCAAAQTRIQYRSGKTARAELIHLKEQYGIEGFAIVDDNFIVDKKKVYDVVNSINDLNLKWSALSRVDTVDEELLNGMHKAGCIEIKFGMESGSPRILKAMRKNIEPEQVRDTAQKAYNAGIKVKFFLVHGYPGEDMDSTLETIELLTELAPIVERASLFRFTPLPGTYVYEHPEEFHLRGTDKNEDWDGDWSKYHIYHNAQHWWGSEHDFENLNIAYNKLREFVDATWPEARFS